MEPPTGLRWWTEETIAVVTGANEGIGFQIVERLALEGLTVVLCCRDECHGLHATEELHAKGLKNVVFRRLDIRSPESRSNFIDWINQTYGGLDILINNATAFFYDNEAEHALETINTNYHGPVSFTEGLLQFFKPSAAGARIVNISSLQGQLINVNDVGLRQQLVDPSSFDVDFINSWAMKYEEACQADNGMEVGYGSSAYHVSKVLLNAYARVLSLRVADRQEGSKIYVNNVHPGTMGTNMCHTWRSTVDNANFAQLKASGRFDSIASAAQGSDTPVWLALLPPGGPSGLFWFNRKEISFYS